MLLDITLKALYTARFECNYRAATVHCSILLDDTVYIFSKPPRTIKEKGNKIVAVFTRRILFLFFVLMLYITSQAQYLLPLWKVQEY